MDPFAQKGPGKEGKEMIEDPYKILGVSPDASDEEIKRAYRELAKKYHPDRNPGDEVAAKKMQQVNAAYEQIKNPEKARQSGPGGTYGGYDPFGFGGYGHGGTGGETGDHYQQAAQNYIRFGRYREALNALENSRERNAHWYYLSALAHDGLGDTVLALEHIRRAVSMEPDNQLYLITLDRIENGGAAYRRQAGNFRGFQVGYNPCLNFLMCWLCNLFCCGGRGFFLCC
jgi:molecular chaperone DnaJ